VGDYALSEQTWQEECVSRLPAERVWWLMKIKTGRNLRPVFCEKGAGENLRPLHYT
jgi:hypothetical protein